MRKVSISWKITAALLTLALVPLAVVTVVLAGLNDKELRQRALDYRLAVADDVNHDILNMIDRAQSEMIAVGHLFADASVDVDTRVELAEASLIGARYLDCVGLYGADGVFIDSLSAGNSAVCRAQRPDRLSEELRSVARAERFFIAGTQRLDDGTLFIPMYIAVYRNPGDVLYGYLWAPLDPAPLAAQMKAMSARRFAREENRVYLIDERLRIIAHASATRLFESLKGKGPAAELGNGGNYLRRDVAYYPEYDVDGRQMLGLVAPIPELGWGTVVEQPKDEVLASVRHTWWTAISLGAVFFIGALLLGLFFGRRLAEPVRSVAAAAARVAKGDFRVRINVPSKDEVGEMADAFNTMASDLESYEQKVIDEARIRNDLSRYLSNELVDGIVQRKMAMKLGGERRRATVMFADVVGFTSLAEKNNPEFVVSILNELFTFVTEIVFRHGGMIDKFIGDAVMAVFGVPVEQPDHARNALRAAEEIQRWLEVGNAKWRKDLGRELHMSIGINSGVVLAGNIGSEKRMEYTVIGDGVNVAARLESLAQPGQILVSEETASLAGESFELKRVGAQTLTGRKDPTGIFSMVEI